mmetsp:Transcript_57676/g.100981  ORF Transcript_57676/g.100981 Transcript_57676/m.100981 type:complete len:635 (-) Transcript_57676:103-2007(-)
MPPRAIEVMNQVHGAPLLGSRKVRCTDCCCCLIFVLALAAMGTLVGFGYHSGNPDVLDRFIRGRDLNGRLCGKDDGVKDFKLAYFTLANSTKPVAPGNWSNWKRSQLRVVCTNRCPEAIEPKPALVISRPAGLCPADMYPEWCTWYGGATVPFTLYCVDPDVLEVEVPLQQWIQDLRLAIWYLALVPPVAISVGFLFLSVIGRCGAVLIWLIIFLAAVIPGGCGFFVFHSAEMSGSKAFGLHDLSPQSQRDIAYGLWILSGLVFVLGCCFARTVHSVISVIRATAQFLKDVPSQLLQPLLFCIVHVLVMASWLVAFLQVAAINAEEGDQQVCLSRSDIYCIKWDPNSHWIALFFLVVMVYWMLNFLHACSHFGTAFAVGAWYFTKPDALTGVKAPIEGGVSCCDIRLSLRAVRYGLARHAGTFAVGSFVISLAKIARLLLWWARKDEESRPSNATVRCCLRCTNCLAICFERFVEFVSEHAYVEVALNGEGFCQSAKASMALAVTRPGLFILVGRVACLIRLLGMAVITISSTYVVGLSLLWWPPEGIANVTAPLVAAALAALVIGEVMMHPVSAATRAALHCFCLDEDHARAIGLSVPEHTPQALLIFVESSEQNDDGQSGCGRCLGRCCPCF